MKKRLRILQVVQSLDFGGLERVVIDLVDNLDRSRFQSDILCLRDYGRNASRVRNRETTVINLGMGRGKSFSIPGKLASLVRHHGYEVVHSHDTSPLLYTALAKIQCPGFRHVFTEHSGIYSCFFRHRLMTAAALLSVNHGVTVSRDLQMYYQRRFSFLCPRLSVIYNGLSQPLADLGGATEVRREFGLAADTPLVGTAVRFYPQKGLRYLLEAVPAVLKRHPQTVFLLIGDGVERQQLQRLAEDAGVAHQVLFPGYRKDVARLLQAVDVYVLPSVWEGLPLALIEAMMARLPVVATAVGGNREMIENGVTGVLVPAKNSLRLAEAIGSLLDDEAGRKRMATEAARVARDRFALPKMIEGYQQLYLHLVENN